MSTSRLSTRGLSSRQAARCFMPYPDAPVAHADAGPLAGLTFAVKDLFDVAGYPTSGGSPMLLAASGIKTRTAPAVQSLLDAGAAFAGKVITDELAYSMAGQNAHFGFPVNGAAPDRITGGSSSGSASAVSNGLVDIALGSDTGGSVRCPASHCGLFGIRPTQGRISLDDCLALAPSFDTCGFFARSAGVFERVADVMLGDDRLALSASPRLLLARDMMALCEPAVQQDCEPLLASLRRQTGDVARVDVQAASGYDFDTLYWAHRLCQAWEAWQVDGPSIERYDMRLGPGVRERFDAARRLTDAEVAPHREVRRAFTQRLHDWLGDRVLVTPTMPDVAPLAAADEASLDDYRNRSIRLLCVAGLSGCPQVSVPVLTRSGAPLGISLIGPPGSDRSLIALAVRLLAG